MAWRNFPIKFYKNIKTGNIEYESAFTLGEATSLDEAFKQLMSQDMVHDLYYYFDDIVDVEIGQYVPAVTVKPKKSRELLGELQVRIETHKHDGMNDPLKSVTYLAKNKEALKDHLKWIEWMKSDQTKQSEETKKTIKQHLIDGINKIKNMFRNKRLTEMFQPVKTTRQLICEHCGRVIPIATYYEYFRGNNYHLECIWDKLVNNQEMNSYESAERFFWSLQDQVGNWPGNGLDVEEDYLSDVELVKHNNRIIRRKPMEESVKSLNETFEYWRNNETII